MSDGEMLMSYMNLELNFSKKYQKYIKQHFYNPSEKRDIFVKVTMSSKMFFEIARINNSL